MKNIMAAQILVMILLPVVLVAAGLVLAGFGLLYQYLFFKYGDGTPGMRYAKIALCTFEDENPTRKAMCMRVLYVLLSAAPLGLGRPAQTPPRDRRGGLRPATPSPLLGEG